MTMPTYAKMLVATVAAWLGTGYALPMLIAAVVFVMVRYLMTPKRVTAYQTTVVQLALLIMSVALITVMEAYAEEATNVEKERLGSNIACVLATPLQMKLRLR